MYVNYAKADMGWLLADDFWMAGTICQGYELVLHCSVLKVHISLAAAADLREGIFVVMEVARDISLQASSCERHSTLRVGHDACVCGSDVQRLQGDFAEVEVDGAYHRDVPAGVCVWQLQAGEFVMNKLQADL